MAFQEFLAKFYLRVQRMWGELTYRPPRGWRTDILAPPLKIGLRTKELVSRHYLEGRYAEGRRPVAWVTSGAPVEFLQALGFYVLYPENHGALCGARRVSVELSGYAESRGYSCDICSYARTDIGALLSGRTPVGRLPKPDLLVACTNICQTVLYWYRVLAHYLGVPFVLIDTPFVYTEEPPGHAVEHVKRQIEEAIGVAERIAGKSLNYNRLVEVMRLSKRATELWLEVLKRAKHRPSPISVFDQFIHMAPIVEMRGRPETVDFYAGMLRELDERVTRGVGAVVNERRRVLWDNLPIWYRLRFLSEFLAERGVAVVASTYTNAWGELSHLIEPERPVESMARVYICPLLNRGVGYKLKVMASMIEEFSIDGVILHSDRSCKPYSIGQMDQRNILMDRYGVPALLLESDHNDSRAFSEEQVVSRLDAFVEMLYQGGGL